MVILDLIFGFLLVFAGRTLFWLCVGIVGFLVGWQCTALLGITDGWMALLTAFVLGCLGTLLTVSFEWFMVIFGVGFLGGGYLLMVIFSSLARQDPYLWLIFVLGGIMGTCLMVIIFDWTLIMISSFLGALLIINAVHGKEGFREFLFISSVAIGIFVQSVTLKETASRENSTGLVKSH